MSCSHTATSSTLSASDSAQIRWFFREGQSVFERSVSGPMIERAEFYAFAAEDRDDRNPKRVGHATKPTMRLNETVVGGRLEPENNDLIRYAFVSRRLERLTGVMVGSPAVSARDVIAVYESPYGDRMGRGTARVRSLCHLTGPGALVVARARESGKAAFVRMVAELGLDGPEIAFVREISTGGTGERAAVRAGYPKESALDIASKLLGTAAIAKAMRWLREADVRAGLRDHQVYENETARRGAEGKWAAKQHMIAIGEAEQLYQSACRAWNAAGVRR